MLLFFELAQQVQLTDETLKSDAGGGKSGTSSNAPPSVTGDASGAFSSPAWCKLVGCGYPSRVKGLELLVVEPATCQALPEDRVGEASSDLDKKHHI